MSLAKLLAATAIAVAPVTIVSAQATTPADSSGNHHARELLAGTGAAAGAGLFLAFTHSGNNASSDASQFSFHSTSTPAVSNPGPSSTGGSTPPTHEDTPGTPSDTGTVNTPNPNTNPPVVGDGNTPPNDGPPPMLTTTDVSTVPEPGSAALLATGIVGLVPLLRRRRK